MKTGQRSMKFSMKRIHGRREAVDAFPLSEPRTWELASSADTHFAPSVVEHSTVFSNAETNLIFLVRKRSLQEKNPFWFSGRNFVSVSALVENEDGTWGLREVTLQEYLRATPEERIEMGWWYGGIENLENGNADPAGFGYIIGITQGKHFNARAYNRCICVMLMFTQSNLNDACGL
ncbi:hypothetical protein Y032_0308g2058 [Ancylostoma ceylanicum]|nr:hypothetical protein Y032_0308g2058 [Ancylostoma ceylanicum]